MHSERLLDHFQNPRNVGELPAPAVTVVVSNPACGDELHLSARFDQNRVAEARYRVRGCTASIASGSALTEWMIGKSPAELRSLNAKMVEELLDELPAESKHAAALAVDGVKRLISLL